MRPPSIIIIFLCALALVALIAARLMQAQRDRRNADLKVFVKQSDLPSSAQNVVVATKRSVFGDGSFVLTLTIPDQEFRSLMQRLGMSPIDIADDPGHWGLDLCNEIILRVASSQIKITPEFECFARTDVHSKGKLSVRFFYDKKQQLAVGLARGRPPRQSTPDASEIRREKEQHNAPVH